MATGDYAVLETLKATLSLTGQTFADADIAAAITSASRAIDNLCNQRFYADATDQIYYYTPARPDLLVLPDVFDSITSVDVDFSGDGTFEQSWVENTNYVAYPLNRATPYRPISWLKVHPLGGFLFPMGYPRTVKVTGKAGWGATPDAVESACSLLATQLLRRSRDAPFVDSSADGGRSASTYAYAIAGLAAADPHIRLLLSPYIRRS